MGALHDYGDDLEEVGGDNVLSVLRGLAQEQIEAEHRVAEAALELSEATEALRVISEQRLPELMDEIGVPKFETSDGLKIDIREIIRTSIGKDEDDKNSAYDWLEENGHGSLLKRTVEVPFLKGQERQAMDLESELRKQGRKAVFRRKVEPATLRAFITEELEAGREVPLDLFKVFRQRTARVTVS